MSRLGSSPGPSKLTQRLLSVRPASCCGFRLAGRSTSTRCRLPTMRCEILIGLTRKSDDDVGGNTDIRAYRFKPAQLLLVLEYRMSTLHGSEDAIGTALHRQVQKIVELRNV